MSKELANPVGVYRSFASYYDAYIGDFRGDYPIYLDGLKPGDKVLEIGCGTGRLLKPALEQGHEVVGIDISNDMLARAEAKLEAYISQDSLRLLKHNMVDAPLNELYDVVWVSFYTFNYLLSNAEAASFLQNIHKSMAEGGVLVMDLFCPSGLLHPEGEGLWTQREITLGEQVVTLKDRRTLQGKIETREQIYEGPDNRQEIVTSRRFYDKQELSELLERARFKNILVTDGYNLKGYHPIKPLEISGCSFVVKACK